MSTTPITHKLLAARLAKLDLSAGHVVLVHSALSRFGWVQGGAEAVIDALLMVVGASGTVLMPTLTGEPTHDPEHPPVFDVERTPCWTGRIPETFRQRPAAVRSVHPTHSVAALGALAEELTQAHIHSVTPCDDLSPYGKLAHRDDGYILLLGVGHEANTTLHHVEERVGVDYHVQSTPTLCTLRFEGQRAQHHYFLHRWDTPRHFDIVEPLLTERAIQRIAQIGQATVRLVAARAMAECVAQCLRANPRFLCQ